MSERTQRRLAAIVSADVVGYSLLVGADETGTLAALRTHRDELIDPMIAEHGGRIVKSMGDGLLLEFASVVDATNCAIAFQRGMTERNQIVEDDRRIVFRIGINLGDIVIDGEDILGDGVNVAARLQEIAKPGGIAVSARVHEDVRDRLDAAFVDDGEHALKNIARPVHVWHWKPAASTAADAHTADAPLPLPDKPSIAVLAFENMSGDPEQGYFADGIAEDIITALSRIGWFFVIARNSSFAYKGRAVDVKQVARELGVRYVLEGSVRKGGERLRVTAQLVDATTGNHIWADRFDGKIEDIFDLQDRITESVVGAIEPKLRLSEIERARRKRPDNLDAYDYFLRALPHVAAVSRSDYEEARRLLERATEADPGYAPALAFGAWCRAFASFCGWSEDPREDVADGLHLAQAAIRADPDDAMALRAAGFATAMLMRDYDGGLALIDKSLALDPNSAFGWCVRGWVNAFAVEIGSATKDMERAIRLSPFDSWSFFFSYGMAYVLMAVDRYDEALTWERQVIQTVPDWVAGYRLSAACLAYLDRTDEARDAARRIMELDPNFTLSRFLEFMPVRAGPFRDRYFEGLRMAGLPE